MASLIGYDLNEAIRCIQRYVDAGLEKHIENSRIVRAYLVSADDAFGALGIDEKTESAYSQFRAYLGIQSDYEYKLFLVPVDENGKDVIPSGPDEYYEHDGQYVFDFNTPCPNSCDTTSPLFYNGPR